MLTFLRLGKVRQDTGWLSTAILPLGLSADIGNDRTAAGHFDGFASPGSLKGEAEQSLLSRLSGRPNFTLLTNADMSHNEAVADIMGLKLSGFIAWLLWRGLYLLRITTLARKSHLFLEWNWGDVLPPGHLAFRLPPDLALFPFHGCSRTADPQQLSSRRTLPMNRTMSSITAAAAATVGLSFALPCAAQDVNSFATGGYAKGLQTMAMMHRIDTNKDGMVSLDEWTAFQEHSFAALDKDKSGFLEEQEFTTHSNGEIAFATAAYAHGLMTNEMFKKIDADGDRKISKEEFLSYQRKIFEMLDRSKKGMVGQTDFVRPGG